MNNQPKQSSHLDHSTYCTFCPAYCCYKLPGSTLLIYADDINRIGRHLQISDGEVRRQYLEGKNTFKTREDGSCIFLRDGALSKRCSIHTARPRQCMDFPYGEPCPYLFRNDLLEQIYPKIEISLLKEF